VAYTPGKGQVTVRRRYIVVIMRTMATRKVKDVQENMARYESTVANHHTRHGPVRAVVNAGRNRKCGVGVGARVSNKRGHVPPSNVGRNPHKPHKREERNVRPACTGRYNAPRAGCGPANRIRRGNNPNVWHGINWARVWGGHGRRGGRMRVGRRVVERCSTGNVCPQSKQQHACWKWGNFMAEGSR